MDIENNINYFLLTDSLRYYQDIGFKYLNVNWSVDKGITAITKPKEKKDFYLNDKCLVASGEQSFLDLIINKNLQKGKYCCITPCFRDESEIDYLHNTYFMKVELINTIDISTDSLMTTINSCLLFFNNNGLECKIVQLSDNEFDIVDCKNGIEIGSYGIRKYDDIEWIFATGLAEPRFTNVKRLND